MTFQLVKQQPNGANSLIHQVARVEISNGTGQVILNSYATLDAYQMSPPQLNWQDTYPVPLANVADAEAWLISADGSFAGATLLDSATTDLATAKAQQWVILKAARDAALTAGFTWDGSLFDSDAVSISRITGAAVLAMMASTAGQTYSVSWTLANNTVRVLDGTSMMAVGVAVGAYVQSVMDTGQALRTKLDATTTVADALAIAWPIATAPPTADATASTPVVSAGGDAANQASVTVAA